MEHVGGPRRTPVHVPDRQPVVRRARRPRKGVRQAEMWAPSTNPKGQPEPVAPDLPDPVLLTSPYPDTLACSSTLTQWNDYEAGHLFVVEFTQGFDGVNYVTYLKFGGYARRNGALDTKPWSVHYATYDPPACEGIGSGSDSGNASPGEELYVEYELNTTSASPVKWAVLRNLWYEDSGGTAVQHHGVNIYEFPDP